MAILIDSFSESNVLGYTTLRWWSTVAVAQSFIATMGVLNSCKFYLKKTGSPSGSAYAKLYAHTGTFGVDGKPTGTELAISDAFEISNLTTSPQLIEFIFSGINKITLTEGTVYYIAIESFWGDESNLVNVGNYGSGHDGNVAMQWYLGIWNAYPDYDASFYVYKDDLIVVGTILGLSRITISTLKIILGKSRIGLITVKTITCISRITKSTAKTILGLSRIGLITIKTILGKSRITIVTPKTISGKARITTTVIGQSGFLKLENGGYLLQENGGKIVLGSTNVIYGISRVTLITVKTVQGLARITVSSVKTILGLARILVSQLRTIVGKARIQLSVGRVITGIARIGLISSESITGISRIRVTVPETILGLSRIQLLTKKTIKGKADILVTQPRTITGHAYITYKKNWYWNVNPSWLIKLSDDWYSTSGTSWQTKTTGGWYNKNTNTWQEKKEFVG